MAGTGSHTAPTKEEVNVGAWALGAQSWEVAGTASGLDTVLAGTKGAQAELKPGAGGTAVVVIDLAWQVVLSRVAIDVGRAGGRLVLIALSEDGESVELSTPEGSRKIIGDKTLDGTQSTIAIDASQRKAKSIMLYWAPETPGTALLITKVGIFTRETTGTSTNSLPETIPPTSREVSL